MGCKKRTWGVLRAPSSMIKVTGKIHRKRRFSTDTSFSPSQQPHSSSVDNGTRGSCREQERITPATTNPTQALLTLSQLLVPPPLDANKEGILRNPDGRKRGSLIPQPFALAIHNIVLVPLLLPRVHRSATTLLCMCLLTAPCP